MLSAQMGLQDIMKTQKSLLGLSGTNLRLIVTTRAEIG